MNILWILIFGVAGVGCRFGVDTLFARYSEWSFPANTFVINLLGCFIAGVCLGPEWQRDFASEPIRFALLVGFCGGFTTFSGYCLQLVQMYSRGEGLAAVGYATGSVVLGIGCVVVGVLAARVFAI